MAKKKYFFSVIIPNYNNGIWLRDCIDSVLFQSFQDFELILVDDVSTDNSVEIMNEYAQEHKNIKVIVNDTKKYNQGSRNVGIDARSDSEYTVYVDSDDMLNNENVFQDIHDLIVEKNYPDCIRLSYQAIRGENKIPVILKEKSPAELVNNVNVACWTRVIKSSLIIKGPENTLMEDAVLNYMQCDLLETVVPIEKVCVDWNRNNTNSCSRDATLQNGKWKSSLYRYVADLMDNVPVHDYCLRERQLRLDKALKNVITKTYSQDK